MNSFGCLLVSTLICYTFTDHGLQIFPCFLHNLNTILGKIVLYPAMKQVATKSARIVSYFNSTHYWGGQLDKEARSLKITRCLKTNTESRWYALILQALSVDSYRLANPIFVSYIKLIFDLVILYQEYVFALMPRRRRMACLLLPQTLSKLYSPSPNTGRN